MSHSIESAAHAGGPRTVWSLPVGYPLIFRRKLESRSIRGRSTDVIAESGNAADVFNIIKAA